jgi:hypothetical protein
LNAFLNWLDYAPMYVGFAIDIVLSVVVALLCVRMQSRLGKWALALLTPFAIGWCLYWMPVWRGADPSEYGAWAPIFIIPLGLSGAVASALAVLIAGAMKRTRAE